LAPGEAVFMPAGNLHAYLCGFGVEVMAASDNVLRGGLTPKGVNVAELLRVLRYDVLRDPVRRPVVLSPGLVTWPVSVPDFSLSRAAIPTGAPAEAAVTLPDGGPRIICCLGGTASLSTGEQAVQLDGGDSVFVSAAEQAVVVTGGGSIVFQSASNP
jgi:mannose-6-phosphate isomerase